MYKRTFTTGVGGVGREYQLCTADSKKRGYNSLRKGGEMHQTKPRCNYIPSPAVVLDASMYGVSMFVMVSFSSLMGDAHE